MDPGEKLQEDGVTVVPLDGMPVDAAYYPEYGAVAVKKGLGRVRERSVLAEELAHHRLGHAVQSDPVEWARQELRAQRAASVWLIPLDRLAEAVAVSSTWDEVADVLDVDPYLLERRVADLTADEVRWVRRRLGRLELGL